MSNKRDLFYVSTIILLLLALGLVQSSKPSPTKIVTVHDNTPTNGCSLPIKVGNYGFIKDGDWAGLQGKVLGKIDNGIDCAYSVYLQPKKQNNRYYASEKYITVNSNNFFPMNGETVR